MTIPSISLLGIPIHAITKEQAVECIMQMTHGTKQCFVATPNNEMLVEADRNAEFYRVLQKTNLNIPDSTGLLLAAKWTRQHLPERTTGVDTVQALCKKLDEKTPVFLLGSAPGVAEKAAQVLQKSNPNLYIAGTYAGSPKDEDAQEIINKINTVKPVVLFVAYGAPAQEMWIHKHLSKLTTVKVSMGVGGTFDFIAGVQKRAPKWMRSIGLEWLWRFIQEPKRYKRMWNATVVFLILILKKGK